MTTTILLGMRVGALIEAVFPPYIFYASLVFFIGLILWLGFLTAISAVPFVSPYHEIAALHCLRRALHV